MVKSTREGLSLIIHTEPKDAMEMFTQHQDEICCVVSDVIMPRMNGWETLTALRKLSSGIPVFPSSGYNEAQMANRQSSRTSPGLPKQAVLDGGAAGGVGESDRELSWVRVNGQKSVPK